MFMLNSRSVVIAAMILGACVLAHAAFPRYQVSSVMADGGGVVLMRVDRWHGTVELGATQNQARPAWLTIAEASRH